jgi:glutathione S-transferase
MLEGTLSEAGPWILGASPSLADINLMPLAARLDVADKAYDSDTIR